MAQGDGLRQVLIQSEGPGDGAGDAADLQGVGHAGAVVVPLGLKKHLGLVLEAAERLTVHDAVCVPLKAGADPALRLWTGPASGLCGPAGVGGEGHCL